MMMPRGAVPADLVDQVVLEPDELTVVQGGVDGRDEVAALPQDGDQRRLRWPAPLWFGIAGPDHFEPQHPFGFFDAALQVAHGAEFAEVDADGRPGSARFPRTGR